MLTCRRYFFLLFCFLIGLNACKETSKNSTVADDVLKVSLTNFTDEIRIKQNLIFTFNKNVVGSAQLNSWTSFPYVEFEPKVEGQFRWTTTNELTFSPRSVFPSSTNFTAKINDNILKHSEVAYKIDIDPIFFNTPMLNLEGINSLWTKSSTRPGENSLKTTLQFNSEINPQDLAGHLSFEVGDIESPEYDVLTKSVSKSVVFEIFGVENIDGDDKIKAKISKGMALFNSNAKTDKAFKVEKLVPEKDRLTIKSVRPDHNGFQGSIYVKTNQQVDENMLRSKIEFKPKVTYSAEVTDNGFVIKSENFSLDKPYEISIQKGLKGILGDPLSEDYKKEFTFGKVEPKIKFVDDKALYLSTRGNRNINVEIVNVAEVTVEIYKVFANNIQEFLRKGQGYDYDYYEYDDYGYEYNEYDTENYAQLVYTEDIETNTLSKNGARRLLKVNFQDKIPQYDGFYMIKVKDKKEHYLADNIMVSLSDIGLICKKERDRIWVFANSIQTAESLAGVQVKFISNNNQDIYTSTTDGDGVAFFDGMNTIAPDFDVSMITAELGDDFNFLPFSKTYVNTSRYEVGGKRRGDLEYDAFLYGERNIYRPGDTLNIAAIVRDMDGKVPADMPIIIGVDMPSGKEYKTVRKALTGNGGVTTAIATTADMPTGAYRVYLKTANDKLLASERINIEEFIPDRIKVTLDLDQKEIELYQNPNLEVSVSAQNFFGPPAANRNYQVELQLRRGYFRAPDFPYFNFRNNKKGIIENLVQEGTTDENGNAFESFKIDSKFEDMGLVNGKVYATVFDENGRAVNQKDNFKVYTQEVFYGIGRFDSYVGTRKALEMPLVAVDKDGKALTGIDANVQIIRYQWKTVLEKNNSGYYRYISQKQEIVERNEIKTLNGPGNLFTFIPKISGRYEIRVYRPESNTYVSRSFYAYGYADTETTSFEVDTEGNVEIALDKKKYKVGESATVLFKTPFDGKMLVTLETDKVQKHFYVQTSNKSAEVNFDFSNEEVPTAYITATLIKPHVNNEMPLLVAHGFQPVEIHNPMNNLEVEIRAEEKSRSRTKQEIFVKSEPNVEVTIAVVDEGILQLKNYKTPDPYNFFYQKRGLEIQSYDLYPLLFPEMVGQSGLTGGDEEGGMSKRLNPLANERVQLVRFWSGIKTTNADGLANFTIDIPQFSGNVRVMAVAYDEQRYGNAEHGMIIADPVVVSTALPRFLSPEDELKIPVTVSNTTDNATSGTVTISATGPINLGETQTHNISIPANSEKVVQFDATALSEVGQSEFVVTVNAMGESFVEEVKLPVRPATSLQKKSGSGAIKAGATENIDWASDYIPQSREGKIVITNNPLMEFAKDLDYLVRYPHGCLEQTISRAFPQIYFNEMVRGIYESEPDEEVDPNPEANVQAAIDKISGMQLSDGGLSYWPGRGYHSWWGSVYALHFLYESKQKGFDVPDHLLDDLKTYVQSRLKTKETYVYYYNRNLSKEIAAKEIAYSLYVLALMGEPDIPSMNYYKGKPAALSLDGKYLLASAFALAGDKKKFEALVPNAFEGEEASKSFGGSFYSYLRDLGITLNCMIEVDPDNPQIGILARQLTKEMKSRRYMNTQERVFAFLALGKIAARNAGSVASADVIADGNVVATFNGQPMTLRYDEINTDQFSINAEGNGYLYYFWTLEGINMSNTYEEKDNFLRIRKTLLDRNGKSISPQDIKQNDLIVIKLNLKSTGKSNVENVVVTDILPACFEVENPRLGELPPSVSWATNYSPDHYDIRDDRILLFTTARNSKNGRNFYYVVRAVSKGNYIMGPASADAMYDGEYYSYSGGGKVSVADR